MTGVAEKEKWRECGIGRLNEVICEFMKQNNHRFGRSEDI